ncbi:preprotein translocase subunit YajC [Crossiella equi]|uniref:Preprotein translocase subunit YajC n=1 Tax=Crossiella equi TaxID=130796 RepID=A0ABS5AR32_9PSEU|nr:preprotein translocase subunit YajC [Crossiella equi]MBP2478165.1 preprotein translocase subunit YajC [Crossiella equi]
MDPSFILPLILLVFAVPLFLSARKQKRAFQEQQQLQKSLAPGDRVMTTSGLYATVVDADDDTTIDLEIAPGVVTTWVRAAVREQVKDSDEETTAVTSGGLVNEEPDEAADKANESKAQVAPPLEQEKNNR